MYVIFIIVIRFVYNQLTGEVIALNKLKLIINCSLQKWHHRSAVLYETGNDHRKRMRQNL